MSHTLKNSDGDITALCNPDESSSPRSVSEVIADIESGTHRYVVLSDEGDTRVQVIDGPHGKYLRTHPNQKVFNNLESSPSAPAQSR